MAQVLFRFPTRKIFAAFLGSSLLNAFGQSIQHMGFKMRFCFEYGGKFLLTSYDPATCRFSQNEMSFDLMEAHNEFLTPDQTTLQPKSRTIKLKQVAANAKAFDPF